MQRIHRTVRTAMLCMVAGSLVCACSESKPPTTPEAVPEAVTITGARDMTQGETATLTATVRYSTGATETVSERVAWSTEDARIAIVNGRGVVTAVEAGEVRIRATLNAVSGSTAIRVAAAARPIAGRVHESRPTEHIAVAGATVTAVDSAGTTQSAVTDGAGRFSMRLARGPARITVNAAGYETSVTELIDEAGTELSLSVLPVQREVRRTFSIDADRTPFVAQRNFVINVHHSGRLEAKYTGSQELASAWQHVCLEVRDAINRRLAHTRGQYDISPDPIRLDVVAGESYKVEFYSCNPTGGTPIVNIADYSGEVRHPS